MEDRCKQPAAFCKPHIHFSGMVQTQLHGVSRIASSYGAFAAILETGSVVPGGSGKVVEGSGFGVQDLGLKVRDLEFLQGSRG